MVHSDIQVDVAVQDCFFQDEENPQGNPILSPVPLEQWEQWFQHWVKDLQTALPEYPGYELGLRLTTDADIQSLNAQYRHNDKPTDVLAFAALEGEYSLPEEIQASFPLYLGDIVISVDTAQVQAQERGHSLRQELAWLAAHGLLHLLGWDHPDEASLTSMLQQQTRLLQRVGLEMQYDDA